MKFLLIVGFALALAGCTNFSAQPDPSRFFTLSALSQGEEGAEKHPAQAPNLSFGIGPVSLPGYLDRQEIVTRIAQNQIRLSDYDRWAEPLEESIARVVSQNVASILRAERITSYPWPIDRRPLYQVELEMLRFETNNSQEAHLAARWTVRNTGKKDSVRYRATRLSRPARASSTDASIAALSEVLEDLSRQIADAIENMTAAANDRQ
jgi:uncharacterized protein